MPRGPMPCPARSTAPLGGKSDPIVYSVLNGSVNPPAPYNFANGTLTVNGSIEIIYTPPADGGVDLEGARIPGQPELLGYAELRRY